MLPLASIRHAKIKQKHIFISMNQLESISAPTHMPTSKTTTKTLLITVSIFKPTLNTHKTLTVTQYTPKQSWSRWHKITRFSLPRWLFHSLGVFSNLPIKPLSPLPYLILRLHIRSLGYQQLSSGGVSIVTCLHQRRLVVLNQTQCEGEVEQLGLDKVGNTLQGSTHVVGS
jgi:hypothetical protein